MCIAGRLKDSNVSFSQAFHVKGDLFLAIPEKMQDSRICCSFRSAVRKGRKSLSLLFQGRENVICKNVSARRTFQFNLDYFLILFFFFLTQMSWLRRLPEVPLFGPGTNYVPMIHVHDLAG